MEKNQRLLYLQTTSGLKKVDRDEIEPYFRQRPNRKVFGLPLSLYFYNFGKNFYDTARINKQIIDATTFYDQKIITSLKDSLKVVRIQKRKAKKLAKLNKKLDEGNWWMRVMGSSPVIFDTTMTEQTRLQFSNYLKSIGFFQSNVTYKIDTVANSIWVKYQFEENTQWMVNKFNYNIYDGSIKRIVNENLEEALIHTNEPFSEQKLVNERERLEKLLRDNGYFEFTKKYIQFEIEPDTASSSVAVTTFIVNPSENELHKVYKINNIKFDVDQISIVLPEADTVTFKGVFFSFNEKKYSPKVLTRKLEISPGSKYNYSRSQYTQRNLNELDMFKFVNITYTKDSTSNGLNALISANSNNKYQVSDEIGFTVSQGVPGPFGSITFANRNVLKGCEIFDIGIRGGIEGVASASNSSSSVKNVYSSKEIGVNSSLTFPELLGMGRLNNLFINNNPRTKLSLGYNLILRPEYDRSNTRFAATYTFQKGRYNQYSFAFIDINYIDNQRIQGSDDTTNTNKFYWYLFTKLKNQGNSLYRSFRNSINTDISFTYTYNSYQLGVNRHATFFRFYVEPGGTTLNLLNQSEIDQLKKNINLYSVYAYLKFNVDLRKYVPVSKKSTFAARINIGISNPYGGDRVMPYEKYFFTGGTNSNRAWLPRRLGPGSFSIKDSVNGQPLIVNGHPSISYKYEQPGLILLELNAEYRFKIIKFLDGAVFIDAGNVWNINGTRQGENFSSNFYTEIAVGAGYGVRLDFSFLIVRLDAGIKMWDPGMPLSERFVAKNLSLSHPLGDPGQALWNIAIGYPF